MKKRVIIAIISIAALIILVFGKLVFNDGKEYKGDIELTKAQVAKSIALLYFTQSQCDSVDEDYFAGVSGSQWYEKYVDILIKEKPEIKVFEAKHKKMKSAFTYSETKRLMKNMGISGKIIDDITKDKDDSAMLSYAEWFNIYSVIVENISLDIKPEKCLLTIAGTAADMSGKEPFAVLTDRGMYNNTGVNMEKYKDTRIEAYIKDNQIIAIGTIAEGIIQYKNVWIKKTEKNNITVFFSGVTRTFEVNGLKNDINNAVADITVGNHKVTNVSVKADTISGKVLEVGDEFIEVAGFGRIPVEDGFRVYRNTDGIMDAAKDEILVGYDAQTIYVADGKICAAVIDKEVKAENIRVLITSNGFKSRYHDNVTVTCTGNYIVSYDEKNEVVPANTVISIAGDSPYLCKGRVSFRPENGTDKICIASLKRGYGNPLYRGSIEVADSSEGLIIINELSLEEYLYSVVPSEMPVSYGIEALKAQAVCARSYAYKHLIANGLSEYGAHVDDSTRFQVYNNSAECEESVKAVEDTKGKVMMYNDEVVSAYFFSNSCGSTTTSAIWGSDPLPYISGRMVDDKGRNIDLTDESEFDKFIRSNEGGYDSTFGWYRWNVVMPVASLQKAINNNIGDIYSASPEAVLTRNESGEFVSTPIESVGKLIDIKTGKRLDGGVLNEIIITGSDATVKILRELNIRKILSPYGNNIIKQDGTVNDSMNMLPSAYFVLDEIVEDGELEGYNIVGGGCGHGAGMSQDAAKVMGETMNYEEILTFFYKDIKIETIWETK